MQGDFFNARVHARKVLERPHVRTLARPRATLARETLLYTEPAGNSLHAVKTFRPMRVVARMHGIVRAFLLASPQSHVRSVARAAVRPARRKKVHRASHRHCQYGASLKAPPKSTMALLD